MLHSQFARVHDDQVDMCGLIGQLLDKMIDANPPKEEKPKVQDGYGDRRQRSDDFDVMTI